ncbi:MAG: hemolysin family protein [Alphaproteobacteria bacterium]|nr:hemolysin family protein [Alphaproteobacteria bacterium]
MDFLFLVLLILLNGVFALSEMAIVSARKPRLKAMADRGSKGAKTALRLLEDPSKLLSTVQIGITLIGVLAGAYGATALSDDFSPWIAETFPGLTPHAPSIAFTLVIVMTTFLSLVLGELIPKRIALSAPEPLAASMAPVMALMEIGSSPLVWLLRTTTEGIVRLLGLHRTRQEDVTEEELQSLIDEGAKVGIIEDEEREMIEGVMRLGDRSVKAIMTPRTEMVWLDTEMSRDELLAEMRDSGHSRFPVGKGDADEIVGVVQTKELFAHLAATGRIELEAVMHPPVFVPETMPVLKLLDSMRGNPVRMVMVSDEYGAVLGIVTAADLLESIAGDGALGENEGISQPVLREDGSWLIDGMTPIDEFEQVVSVRGLDDGEGYSTVAGLVMHQLRTVPKEGDRTERWPLAFEVVDMDGRRIDKVIVRRLERPDDPTG